jgi:hypothetical protein
MGNKKNPRKKKDESGDSTYAMQNPKDKNGLILPTMTPYTVAYRRRLDLGLAAVVPDRHHQRSS